MKNINKIENIAIRIEKAGGRLYLVGGALRDKFLQRLNYDEDYCVTGITAEKFRSMFPEAKVQGKSFKVFILEGKEFAMARTEKKTGIGHKEFEIQTNENITIQEDLKRRDITINSIAQDVLTKEIIDPFLGQDDIKNKIIRATSNNFIEDPLRVYRVARFSAELGFKIEENTIKMMNSLKQELKSLSKERVFVEFKKALASNKPSLFFNALREADVLEVHFKQIYDLIGALQPEEYHPEGDSYNHTMICLDKSAQLTDRLEVRFATLVHDLGKGTTPKEEYPHHYGHEERGVMLVEEFAKELGIPNNWKKCGKTACKEHMRGGIFYKMKPSKKISFLEKVDKTYLGLEGLQVVVNCDKSRNEDIERKEEYNFSDIGKKCFEEVTAKKVGKKYGLAQGIELGNKLHEERIKWLKENQSYSEE